MKAILKKVLNSTLHPFNFKVKQKGVVIPVSNGIGYTNFVLGSEKWLHDLLSKLQTLEDHKEGLFIDVGTNIGQTLIKLKRINKNIRYLGFEPNPHCFYYTTMLIEENKWVNSFVIPAALSNENKLLTLRTGNRIDAEGSIIDGLRPNKKKDREVMINASVFDALIPAADIRDLKVVKIDVEGAELNVLEGMRGTINTLRPIVICEVLHANSPGELAMCNTRNEKLEALLKSVHYTIYRIGKSATNDTVSFLTKLAHFDNRVFDKSSEKLCDFIFIPEESEEIIEKLFNKEIKPEQQLNFISVLHENDIAGEPTVILDI